METQMNTVAGIKLGIRSQLKAIEEQIESMAKNLELQGSESESAELYELGDLVEHFCDKLESTESAARPRGQPLGR